MVSGDHDSAVTNEHAEHLYAVKNGSEFLRGQIDDWIHSAIALTLTDGEFTFLFDTEHNLGVFQFQIVLHARIVTFTQ